MRVGDLERLPIRSFIHKQLDDLSVLVFNCNVVGILKPSWTGSMAMKHGLIIGLLAVTAVALGGYAYLQNGYLIEEIRQRSEASEVLTKVQSDLKAARDEVVLLQTAKVSTENDLKAVRDQIERSKTAMDKADNSAKVALDQIAALQAAKTQADVELNATREQIARLQARVSAAETAGNDASVQLAKERSAREAAERALMDAKKSDNGTVR